MIVVQSGFSGGVEYAILRESAIDLDKELEKLQGGCSRCNGKRKKTKKSVWRTK
jgi:hypothetical protein